LEKMLGKDLVEEKAFELKSICYIRQTGQRIFQAAGTASTKALRQVRVWRVGDHRFPKEQRIFFFRCL
jgi:hypothetical protein